MDNKKICPECGMENDADVYACKRCGYTFVDFCVCEECGTEYPADYEECPHCGRGNKAFAKAETNMAGAYINKNKKTFFYILIALAIVFAVVSIKIRFFGDYDYYSRVIVDYQDNKIEYRQSRNENQKEADSYKGGLFKYGYQDIANGYQDLMDDADERIAYYEGLKTKVIVESAICIALAVALVIIAMKCFYKGEEKDGFNKVS